MIKSIYNAIFVATLFSSAALAAPQPQFTSPPLAVLYDELLTALGKGENLIYIVPTETDGKNQPSSGEWWKNCVLNEHLSDRGRKEARKLGAAFRNMDFPFFLISVSEVCITLEMASTVFTGSILKFDPTSDLNPAEFQRAQFNYKPEVISLQIHGALAGSIQIEENSFIFGHRQPSAIAPHPIISELQAGDTAILFFSPTGELRLRARLDVRQWEELAKYAQKLKSVATKTRTSPTTKRK